MYFLGKNHREIQFKFYRFLLSKAIFFSQKEKNNNNERKKEPRTGSRLAFISLPLVKEIT